MILNIGAGKTQRKECVNVDCTPYPGIDQVVDLSVYPWPWADESIDGIHADHVIEHLPDQKVFILECLRILKKGGFLRMRLPHSSSPSGIGCMGHYRTYSYNTLHCYLSEDFYMFGKAKFRTVEKKLTWWYETGDSYHLLPLWIWCIICVVDPIINLFIRLSPEIFENFWWAYVGGAKEVVWKGVKL